MVTVVNESASRLLFPGEDPIGRQILLGDAPLEVVGVVGDARNQGVNQPPFPEVFANYRQLPGATNQLFLLVRTAVEPLSVLPGIREQVREMDADQPVYAIRTADELIAASTASERIAANALSIFAAFALILAAVGIFAVVSFSVAERTREIGLRVALGAESASVRWLMVRQALTPVIWGGVVGLVGAVGVGMALEDLLFQVRGTDPLTLSSVTFTFLGVALLASYLPARRASRLDPVNALRED